METMHEEHVILFGVEGDMDRVDEGTDKKRGWNWRSNGMIHEFH
jgi:hypothetical protein